MVLCFRRVSLLLCHVLLLQPALSAAYSWVLTAPAEQCSNLSISIIGSDGVPPYRVLVVPSGPTPLPNDTEVRAIIDYTFEGDSTTASFAINYPANSQFVAVVSDASGFGTGGTGVATQVLESADHSCFSPSKPYTPAFFFYVGTDNQVTQCQANRIWWGASTVQGTPMFNGVIPGGQSFTIPESSITDTQAEGTGFSWTPSVKGGTTLILVAGDNRGMGSGGAATFYVNFNSDGTCLNSQSASSTPGNPAGAYSTSTVASSTGSSSSTSTSAASGSGGSKISTTLIGAIVGGVVGGLLLIICVLLCLLWRNSRMRRHKNNRPIDILDDSPATEEISPIRAPRSTMGDILSFYRIDPFTTPGPSQNPSESAYTSPQWHNNGPGGLTDTSNASRYHRTSEFGSGYGPPSPSSPRRSQGWGADFIQHKDAGVILLPPEEQRVVELPPRYDNIGIPGRLSPEDVARSRGLYNPI